MTEITEMLPPSRAMTLARRDKLDLLATLTELWHHKGRGAQFKLETVGLRTREQLVCNILNLEERQQEI